MTYIPEPTLADEQANEQAIAALAARLRTAHTADPARFAQWFPDVDPAAADVVLVFGALASVALTRRGLMPVEEAAVELDRWLEAIA